MSTAFAIAAAVGALKRLLEAGLDELGLDQLLSVNKGMVHCLAPDRVLPTMTGINLFVHHCSRNSGWSNQDLPARDSRGDRVANPALAIDLHLLLTAYGADKHLHAEVLLGASMQVLHENPVLGPQALRELLAPPNGASPLQNALAEAGLDRQLEQLRITSHNPTADEMSRIWSAIQLPMRHCAAYQLSVLLLESRRSRRVALPVLRRRLNVTPWAEPELRLLGHRDGISTAVLPGSALVIEGSGLRTAGWQLELQGQVVAVDDTSSDSRLEFTLPSTLAAGTCTAQLRQPALGKRSNSLVFVLNPRATFAVQNNVVDRTEGGVTYRRGTIRVTLTPPVTAAQRVRLLLNASGTSAGSPSAGYSFDAPAGNGIGTNASFAVDVDIGFSGVAAGKYRLRVQVDAATSPLTMDDEDATAGRELTL